MNKTYSKYITLGFLITLFILSHPDVESQTIKFAQNTGSSGWDSGNSITIDNKGCIYITGNFSGTVDFDPGPGIFTLTSEGSDDIFIQKLTNSGNLMWVKRIGGTGSDIGHSITVDLFKNIYVTGRFNGTVDFNPGKEVFNLASAGSYDIFVQKLDASGNFVWAKGMGGKSWDKGNSLAVDAVGNVYTTGYYRDTSDFNPGEGVFNLFPSSTMVESFFVQKLDSKGNFNWAISVSSSWRIQGNSILIDIHGNIFTIGTISGTADFDPGAGIFNQTSNGEDIFIQKLNASGEFIWAKIIGGKKWDYGNSITTDISGNIYITGSFQDEVDFDPDTTSYKLYTSNGKLFVQKLDSAGNFVWVRSMDDSYSYSGGTSIRVGSDQNIYVAGSCANVKPDGTTDSDVLLRKLDNFGTLIWQKQMGGSSRDYGNSVAVDPLGNVYCTGYFEGNSYFGLNELISAGGDDIFVAKIDGRLTSQYPSIISGTIFNDLNKNCVYEKTSDLPLKNYLAKAEPGPYYIYSDTTGKYTFGIDTGFYTVSLIPSKNLKDLSATTCPIVKIYSLTVTSNDSLISEINFGNEIKLCPVLKVNVASNRIRRCFRSSAKVDYSNQGTASASNVKIKVTFPDYVIPISSKPIWSSKNGNVLTYDIGTLTADASGSITILDSVICGNEAIRGLTQCIKAEIFPANTCLSPSTDWDKSSIKVTGKCENDLVKMVVKNGGSGSMVSSSEYRVFINNVLVKKESFKINAGDSLVLTIPANGKTVRVEADQHPKHPGYSKPRATTEACGVPVSAKADMGFFLQAPLDNGNADEQTSCGIILDSYDPNEKEVVPSGVTASNYTSSNAEFEYTIHFQNTGSDSAYNIIVIDTLSPFLDASTFSSEISSHPYTVAFEGKGQTVKWTFKNIYLPDSTTDKLGSMGFVKYKISQKAGNSKGKVIRNKAFIYFDYNSPIITNDTKNTVFDTVIADYSQAAGITVVEPMVTSVNQAGTESVIQVYPNPAKDKLFIESPTAGIKLSIMNVTGQKVLEQTLSLNNTVINIQHLPEGVYVYKMVGERVNKVSKLVIAR